jgi:hypothetical protein
LIGTEKSKKSIIDFEDDLQCLTKALPTSESSTSKCLIDLLFGFLGTVFSTNNAVLINSIQKEIKKIAKALPH